jgi:hypothetical protein
MFEIKMDGLKKYIATCVVFFISSFAFSQSQAPVDFIPSFKNNERIIYQLVETKFKQNQNGHYLYLMYDTSYMVFNVNETNDSQTIIHFNFADAIINNTIFNLEDTKKEYLRTETYRLVFSPKGEFVELENWELFAGILIDNLKTKYKNNLIDSNTLKYYYIYYHSQENVENAVIARVLDLVDILGESYRMETNYSLAREMVNPFGGANLLKSCTFKPSKVNEYPNSVFFSGKLVSNAEDNDKMQEDYYALMNQSKPDDDSEINIPFVYMEDTYNYQWGEISKRIISYNTTHTVYFGKDKQGLDRVYSLYPY